MTALRTMALVICFVGGAGDEWRGEWGGRRGRVSDAPLLVHEMDAEIFRFASNDNGAGVTF